jgi:hypothetical protein
MKTVLLFSILSLACGIQQAAADELQFDLKKAQRLVEEALHEGIAALGDLLDIDAALQPPEAGDGSQWGHLRLHIYPKGKGAPNDRLTAEGWFRFDNRPGEDELHLGFKFSGRPPAVIADDAI